MMEVWEPNKLTMDSEGHRKRMTKHILDHKKKTRRIGIGSPQAYLPLSKTSMSVQMTVMEMCATMK